MGLCLTLCIRNCKQNWVIYNRSRQKKHLNTLIDEATKDNTPWLSLENVECMAKVLDVCDGDTLTLAIPFESKLYQKKCRLLGLDTAEIRTKNLKEKEIGLAAKDFVTRLILNKKVLVNCGKDDKYGRLLVKLFVSEEDKINDNDLSSQIVNVGLGYVYDGGLKKKFEEWYRVEGQTNISDDIDCVDGELVHIDPTYISFQ